MKKYKWNRSAACLICFLLIFAFCVSSYAAEGENEPVTASVSETELSEKVSEAISEVPESVSEAPAETGEAPESVSEASAETGEAPESISEAPAETDEVPESVSEAPAETDEAPDAVSETTEETGETPVPEDDTVEEITGPVQEERVEAPFKETGTFSFYTVNPYGYRLNSYYNTQKGIYYLFYTNTGSLSDVVITYEGVRLTEVNQGELDIYDHVIKNAFSVSGDEIAAKDAAGKTYRIVALRSEIPSICISLNGVTLSQIHAGSKEIKYPGNTVLITDAAGELDVLAENNVELKGRGNTTWFLSDKRPYQIKFDKKTKVLGMNKAKKWVLLANAIDDSLERNLSAFGIAEDIGMEYTMEYTPVDLWIDGEYRGNYSLGEKIEIGDGRVELTSDLGIIVEEDNAYYSKEDYYFYNDRLKYYFTVSEVGDDTDANIRSAMSLFNNKLNRLMDYINSTPAASVTIAGLSRYMDVDSFAKWYIVSEFTSNVESHYTSAFWYMDGPDDVIHMGPVWDFDTGQGNSLNYNQVNLEYLKNNQHMYMRLMKIPAFASYVESLIKHSDSALKSAAEKALDVAAGMHSSADMNYSRWNMLGKTNPKGGTGGLLPFAGTYDAAAERLSTWLTARYKFFMGKVEADICFSGGNILVSVNDYRNYTKVSAAAWSEESGQKDLKWYTLNRNADGILFALIPVSQFTHTGKVIVHVYSNDTKFLTQLTITLARPEVTYSVSEDGKTLTVTAKNAGGLYTSLKCAVWTDKNGQDDIKWYTLKNAGDGTWTASVSLKNHGKSEAYNFHTYGMYSGKNVFLSGTHREVKMDILDPVLSLSQNKEKNTLEIELKNCADSINVRFAVWGAAKGQNDLAWYKAVKAQDGSWKYSVDLDKHRETGVYSVHAYEGNGIITGTDVEIEKKDEPDEPDPRPDPAGEKLEITPSADGSSISICLKNASGRQAIVFPVWTSENGQDDIVWYKAVSDGAGSWSLTVDTAAHGGSGTYNVHCYEQAGGAQRIVGGSSVRVEAKAEEPVVSAVSEGASVVLFAQNVPAFSNVRFAVWTAENGQDDLVWYFAEKTGSTWTVRINPARHTPGSRLIVHGYGVKNGKNTFIEETVINK